MVGGAAGQGFHVLDVQAQGRGEVEVALEHFVARVGPAVAEGEFVAGVLHVFVEVLREERIVEVTHHQGHQAGAHTQQFRVGRVDLVAPQRVGGGQRRGMERGDDQFVIGLVVPHPRADEPLMGGRQDHVVQGLLERKGLGAVGGEPVRPVVDGQPQPVALGGIGELQRTQRVRQVGGVALLQAQRIDAEVLGQGDQLPAGLVLAEVVANDAYQWITSPEGVVGWTQFLSLATRMGGT